MNGTINLGILKDEAVVVDRHQIRVEKVSGTFLPGFYFEGNSAGNL